MSPPCSIASRDTSSSAKDFLISLSVSWYYAARVRILMDILEGRPTVLQLQVEYKFSRFPDMIFVAIS